MYGKKSSCNKKLENLKRGINGVTLQKTELTLAEVEKKLGIEEWTLKITDIDSISF